MMSNNSTSRSSSLQLYKRPRLANESSDVYSDVKKTAETLMLQQASWKTECEIMAKRLDDAKTIIQEQQKRIVALSEVKGKLKGIVSEQLKALDRFKFAAIEADTLHAATKEQISKALFELEEGKRDREKLKAIFNEIQERYLSLQSESKALRQELDQTKGRLEEESKSLSDEQTCRGELMVAFKSKESELCEMISAKENLCGELSALQSTCQEQKALIENLQSTISALEKTSARKDQVAQELQKQIETETESHLKVVNYMEEQLSHQKIENESLCEKVTELQRSLSEKEGTVEELTSQIHNLDVELGQSKSKAEEGISRESQLRLMNEEFGLKLQEMTLSYQQMSTNFADSSKLNDDLKLSCQQHEQRNSELISQHEQNIAELESKLSSAESEYEKLETDHQHLSLEYEKGNGEIESITSDMKTLLCELDAAEQSIANKESLYNEASRNLCEYEAQYKSLSELAGQREEEISRLATTKAQLQEDLQRKETQRRTQEEEMQGRVLELEEENQELRREKEEIAEELEAEKIVNAKLTETRKTLQKSKSKPKTVGVPKEKAAPSACVSGFAKPSKRVTNNYSKRGQQASRSRSRVPIKAVSNDAKEFSFFSEDEELK